MQEYKDSELITGILNGNIDLYSQIMTKYKDTVFLVVAKRVPDQEVSSVVHDTFLQAYNSLKSY